MVGTRAREGREAVGTDGGGNGEKRAMGKGGGMEGPGVGLDTEGLGEMGDAVGRGGTGAVGGGTTTGGDGSSVSSKKSTQEKEGEDDEEELDAAFKDPTESEFQKEYILLDLVKRIFETFGSPIELPDESLQAKGVSSSKTTSPLRRRLLSGVRNK